jgi:hypothetical protein
MGPADTIGEMEASSPSLPVVVFVRDLLFQSKITAQARAAGVLVQTVRDPARLAETPGRLLLVDLGEPGAIPAAVEWRARYGRDVVGFVSHVDTATIAAARDAGLTQVLARGAFTAQLESILTSG